ncbi:MAG: phosphohistidine phosphatase SixA [Candidatus Abyssubacteria bacterium]
MKAYLVQHGEATSKEVNPDRPLTDKGRSDVFKVAALIRPLALQVGEIVHSGKARAAQTAELLAEVIVSVGGVKARDGLAPNDPVEPLREELNSVSQDIMLVGHLPFLGKLAAALVTGSEERNVVSFRQGGIVCLERSDDKRWAVAWMVTPDILK